MRLSKVYQLCLLVAMCHSCAIARTQDEPGNADLGVRNTDGDAPNPQTAGNTTGATIANSPNAPRPPTPTLPTSVIADQSDALPVANVMANYTTIGRFAPAGTNALTFALPSSQIGGRFTGTSLSVTLSDTGYDYFDVIIDGVKRVAPSFPVTAGCLPVAAAQAQNSNANATTPCVQSVLSNVARTYVVATDLAPGKHVAWLIKRTEMYQGQGALAVGMTTFYGFVLDADATLLTAPTRNMRRIDFVGDSGFTGYGAGQLTHGASDACSFTPANQDAAASVPYLTGALLSADAINVSSSGQGVVHGAYDTNPSHLLPVLYEETLPPLASPVYDFNTNVADVVVLAAGGDDLIGNSGSGKFADPNAFVAGYAAWLVKIRSHYPDALIVCALTSGAQTQDIVTLGGALQQAVAIRTNAGDANVVYYSFFQDDPSFTTYSDIATQCKFYYGCKGHPSPDGAQWLAGRLATYLRGKMGWAEPPVAP